MKVLFFTHDKSDYKQGYYYTDWLNVFRDIENVIVADPDENDWHSLDHNEIDLVVIGHSTQHFLLPLFSSKQSSYKFWRPVNKFYRYARRFFENCNTIIFSKNDYKAIREKVILSKFLNAKLTITHSRESIVDFFRHGLSSDETLWLPFSYNNLLFRRIDTVRKDIDIGYRGNMNEVWIGDIRHRFLKAIEDQCSNFTLDLAPSKKAENFLHGQDYAAWLNRCTIFANTNSAVQTAGPRFFEAIACGATILAPVHRYEGLLYPDEHYVAVHDDFHDVYAKTKKFLSDSDYRMHIQKNAQRLTQSISIKAQYEQLIDTLKQRRII